MKKFSLLLFFIMLFVALPILADDEDDDNTNETDSGLGRISGKIFNKDTSAVLPGATIQLIQQSDNRVVGGSVSDKAGLFKIENIPFGRYNVKISYVGYRIKEYHSFIITQKKHSFKLRNVIMMSEDIKTDEVEVTAQKEMMQMNFDRKIYNVDKNITAQGGSAIDAMKNIPSVTFDIDNNVSLRGSANVRILVDGKPSGLANSDLLDMIPSSSIERIEVITNPSAKYDPDGNAGMINIVLKKENKRGMNGMVQFNAGTGDKYNTSLNFNMMHNDFNFFANYNNRFFAMTGFGELSRNNIISDSVYHLDQHEDFLRRGYNHSLRAGADYSFDKANSITGSLLYNFGTRISREDEHNYNYDPNKLLSSAYFRNGNENFPNHNTDISLNYRHAFDEKMHEWTADIFYSDALREFNNLYKMDNYAIINQKIVETGLPWNQYKTISANKNSNFTIQTDYVRPLNGKGKFEAGYKTTIRHADMDFSYLNLDTATSVWQNDSFKSNRFIYDEAVNAVYANYADTYWILKLQLGLRAELAFTHGDQRATSQTFDRRYFSLFPTIHAKYDINDLHSLNLSYSRRINRPNYRELNPFIDYEDPLNLESGNPNLTPEYSNSYEFGVTSVFLTTTFSSNIFYRKTEGVIEDVRTLLDSVVTISYPLNMLDNQSLGLEFNIQQEITSWWKFDAGYSYYRFMVDGSYIDSTRSQHRLVDLSSDDYTWNARFNTNINIEKMLDFQLSGYYNAPHRTAQETHKEMYSVDMGLKWSLMEGNLIINFRVSDVFNTWKWANSAYSYNFYLDSYRKRASRVANLGFTYKFNDYKRRNGKKEEDNRDIMDMD